MKTARYRHKTRNLQRTAVKIRKFIPNVDLYTHLPPPSIFISDDFFPSSWPLLRKSRILTIHRTSKSYNRETKIYVDSYSAKKKRKKTRRKKSFPRDTYEDESRELHSKIIRFIGKVVHTTVNERAKIHMQTNAEFINEIRERTAHAIHFLLNITFNILHMFRKSSWE